jgi:hypothetical protein
MSSSVGSKTLGGATSISGPKSSELSVDVEEDLGVEGWAAFFDGERLGLLFLKKLCGEAIRESFQVIDVVQDVSELDKLRPNRDVNELCRVLGLTLGTIQFGCILLARVREIEDSESNLITELVADLLEARELQSTFEAIFDHIVKESNGDLNFISTELLDDLSDTDRVDDVRGHVVLAELSIVLDGGECFCFLSHVFTFWEFPINVNRGFSVEHLSRLPIACGGHPIISH